MTPAGTRAPAAAGQGLAGQQPELIRVPGPGLLVHRVEVVGGRRPLHDEHGPVRLGRGDVLDHAGDGQLARGGAPESLLVIEVAGGETQELPVLGQGTQEVGLLAGLKGLVAHKSRLERIAVTF